MPNHPPAIRSASHPLTNQKIFDLILQEDIGSKRILDIGAGRGYMARKLGGYLAGKGLDPRDVLVACDLFPEFFEYEGVECIKVNAIDRLPFDNNSFDIVYAIEVVEHLQNPYAFIGEIFRIVKPGGSILLSMPNILNISSRISFFLNGFHVLFEPLSFKDEDAGRLCGHIMPLSYFYIEHGMRKSGFVRTDVFPDKFKKSNLALYYLCGIMFKAAFRRFVRQIIRKNPYLYEVNREALSQVNSKTLLCSRSCIMRGLKPR
ncbi:MAG: class I SAM-dependent methyltransferase [Desulfuromonadaceae bacterium]|nr:class I SAM-dependent methyltransferase [Desulfuromonadaceae bacterium]